MVDTKTFTIRGKEYEVADYAAGLNETELKKYMNESVVKNILGSNYKNINSLFDFIGYDNEDVKYCMDLIISFILLSNLYIIKLSIPSLTKSELTLEEAKDYLNEVATAIEEDAAVVQDAYEEYRSKLNDITEEQAKIIEEKINNKNKDGGMTPEEFNNILNKTKKPINTSLIVGVVVCIVVVLIIIGIIIAVVQSKKKKNGDSFDKYLAQFTTQSTKL